MPEHDLVPEGKYVVPALAQGLALIGLFTRDTVSLTAPDIATRLGLSRTTVFRLLHTLQTMGFLRRDLDERSYKLGPALLGHGFAYLASLDLVEIAQPILQTLRDDTGLSAHMAVRDGPEIVYVARFAARATVASSVHIGTRFPIHATVMGRMMICDASDAELAALFPAEPLPAFSDQTPRTLVELKSILVADRARGYGVSQSFFERGVSSVAAPVRDGSGRVVAAINITSVDHQTPLEEMGGWLKDAVLRAAAEIAQWISRDEGEASASTPAVGRLGASRRPPPAAVGVDAADKPPLGSAPTSAN